MIFQGGFMVGIQYKIVCLIVKKCLITPIDSQKAMGGRVGWDPLTKNPFRKLETERSVKKKF